MSVRFFPTHVLRFRMTSGATTLPRGKLLCREGTDADRVFFLVSGSISTSTSIAPGVGRKKAMDRRHLNLEKGDEFTQNRRQHKYRDHGAVCVVEFAGQLHSCLQSMMSAEDGTVVISVQFTVLEAVVPDGTRERTLEVDKPSFSCPLPGRDRDQRCASVALDVVSAVFGLVCY